MGVYSINAVGDGVLSSLPDALRNIQKNGNAGGGAIVISNIIGQEVLRSLVTSDREVLHIEHLSKGVYVVQLISAGGERRCVKLVKE